VIVHAGGSFQFLNARVRKPVLSKDRHRLLQNFLSVLIAASTGIRQSELFALKWGDINFSEGTMNVTRSIVHGFVGPCKTESSQKPYRSIRS
jgi:integrase